MDITDEDVHEYKLLHEAEFKKSISDAEAREIATRLLVLYEMLAELLPSERKPRDEIPHKNE